MKTINLKESALINNINIVALSCFRRPILIVIDNATKDYVYYFLLLELEQQTGFLTDIINRKIKNMIFYDVERVCEKIDNLDKTIKNMIDNERYMIICINLYYSKRHTNYFNREHHMHFCLLKGYDEETGEIIIIDEEPELLSASRTSFNDYKEQRISFKELMFMSSNINEILEENEKTDDNSLFVYYEVKLNKNKISNLEKNYMLETYRLMLSDLAEYSDNKQMMYINRIRQFQKKVNENSYDFLSIYPYPKEIEGLLKHIDSLNLQYRVLELIMNKNIFEEEIKYSFGKLIARFEGIKKLLIKFFYSKSNSIIDKVIEQYIKGISLDECIVYRKIIRLIEDGNICLDYNAQKEITNKVEEKISDNNSKYQYIDISDSFNGKCFINDVDKIKKIDQVVMRDFIENGELICAGSLVNETYLVLEAFKFRLPQIQDNKYDNMTKLYFSNNGYRYRSIGCETCCNPIPSTANTVAKIIRELEDTTISERSGRAQDKESDYMMQKLRSLGYM